MAHQKLPTTNHRAPSKNHPVSKSKRLFRFGSAAILGHQRLITVCAVLLLICVLASYYSMTIGDFHYHFSQYIDAIFGRGSEQDLRIIRDYRMPRVFLAFFAGASLGVSGAVFQSLSKNPLGSPDIVGFTQGATTGAIIQIVIFNSGPAMVALTAFLGGVATALTVYFLSRSNRLQSNTGSDRLILVGIGMGATLSAVNGLILAHGDLFLSIEANIWRTGSLDGRDWGNVWPVVLVAIICIPLTGLLARRLTLIESGDELASQLGIPVERTRFMVIILAVALVSVATASCGPIAFIALAAPQILRRVARYPEVSIYGAGLMGAALLVLADVAARSVPLSVSLPVGRVTGLIGGIYMIWLIGIKGRRNA